MQSKNCSLQDSGDADNFIIAERMWLALPFTHSETLQDQQVIASTASDFFSLSLCWRRLAGTQAGPVHHSEGALYMTAVHDALKETSIVELLWCVCNGHAVHLPHLISSSQQCRIVAAMLMLVPAVYLCAVSTCRSEHQAKDVELMAGCHEHTGWCELHPEDA